MNTSLLSELKIHCNHLEIQNKELQQVNAELKDSLSHQKNSFAYSPSGQLTLTKEGLIAKIDATGAKTLGLQQKLLLQRPFSDFVAESDNALWQNLMLSLAQNSKRHCFELKLKRLDNHIFHAQLDCLRLERDGESNTIQVALLDFHESKSLDLSRIENELCIAATVFESQVGMIVTDANEIMLRVNSAFSDITGYSSEEAIGKTPRMLSSDFHDKAFYVAMWESIKLTGSWTGEIWNSRKNGQAYPEFMTIAAVSNKSGLITNYVATLTDSAKTKHQEQQRLADESAQRDTLVREVHHRIKNNLQGVTGVLRNFVTQHPEFSIPIASAISQVQSIAIIHGLQGRMSSTKVRLCELTSEIALNNESLWNTPVLVDIPSEWQPCLIADIEAVPLALVLNELISNAIKHGDKSKGVKITLRHEPLHYMVQVNIINHGQLPANFDIHKANSIGTGLQLVLSLLPKTGVGITLKNIGDTVLTQIELGPTTIILEKK
jgi:PAS domain S-box-containing protein